jgi:tetratricopeptide (TPR) repeat protein
MSAATTRKMRRSRDAAGASNEDLTALSGAELYNVQGNSISALEIYAARKKETPNSLAATYNHLLLSQIVSLSQKQNAANAQSFLQALNDFEKQAAILSHEQLLSTRKQKRNDYIMTYNKALVLYSSGEFDACLKACALKLKDIVHEKQKVLDEFVVVLSRMAFLVLECVLAQSLSGISSGISKQQSELIDIDKLVVWLNTLDSKNDPQFKFLLSLYKSRLDLAELDEYGKHMEPKIRSARKELKSAMEILQHKLRPSFGADTGSVASSQNSEENMFAAPTHHSNDYQQQQPSSMVLQKHNQAALNLKANLEQLKGNTKKSLILCSEALGAAVPDSNYEGIHANNLGIVYEVSRKRHLALHSFAKGLQATSGESSSALFHPDGTARLNMTIMILYNAGLGSLQACNYLSAYECLATCVSQSKVFRSRPKCWIRMAEACLGVYSQQSSKEPSGCVASIDFEG